MAKSNGEPTRAEKALQGFVDQLVETMEDASKNLSWTKGWIGGAKHFLGLPQNIKGNTYLGSNALMLQLYTMKKGYNMPVFMTGKQANELGAHILKGEKSTNVIKAGVNVYDKDGHRVSLDFYDNLSDEEKKEYHVRPYIKSFWEFNIDQTNFKDVHPDRYESLLAKFQPDIEMRSDTKGMYENEALDKVIKDEGAWICPIKSIPGSEAFYRPSTNEINVPAKENFRIHPDNVEETFKDGQEFYSTVLHEMAHSTGHKSQLNREGVTSGKAHFGNDVYAKEELVAELTAAMVSNALGFDKRITENSAAYLNSWVKKLRQNPKYITSVLSDVNKASRLEIERIDVQRKALGQKPLMDGNLDGIEEKKQNREDMEAAVSEAIEIGKKEVQLLGFFGLPVQDTYYNEVELTEEKSDGTVRDLYDKYSLYNLFNDGENEEIMARMKAVREQNNLTFDNTLPSSFKFDLPKYENLGEDQDYVYMLSPDNDKGFVMEAKVSKDDLLHKHLPQHLDPDHLSVIGYDEKRIEDIMSLAGALGLVLEKPGNKKSSTVDVAETVEDEKDIKDNPEKEVFYAGADIIDKRLAGSFQTYLENGDTASMLGEARSWMQQNHSTVEQYMIMDSSEIATENIIAEDDTLAIVNDQLSYDVFPKLTKEEILADIKENGVASDASHVVRDIAYEDIARQFAEKKRDPVLEMPSGDLLTWRYNKETNTLDVGPGTDASIVVRNAFAYHNGQTLDENLGAVTEELRQLPYYQKSEELSEEKKRKRAVFNDILSQSSHSLTMPNGRKVDYAYEMEFNTVSFAITSEGVTHAFQSYGYNLGKDFDANLAAFKRNLSSRPEFKEQVSSTVDVAEIEENEDVSQIKNNNNMDEKNVTENPEKEVYYVAADNVSAEYAEDFEAYRQNGNKAAMLNTARDMMRQYGTSVEQHMIMQPSEVAKENIIAEDENMAVAYNESSTSYDILPKLTKEQILEDIRKNGLESDASPVVKTIAYEDIARQFSEIKSMPVLQMPNGDDLYIQYNKEFNKIEVGSPTNVGLAVSHEFEYDMDQSLDDNLQIVNEELSKMPEYQKLEDDVSEGEDVSIGSSEETTKVEMDEKDEKKYYSSFSFMQMQEDTEQFEKLKDEGRYDDILSLASEYDQGEDVDLDYIKEHAHAYSGDDVLCENEDYAVVYNGSNGGTYDLLKKVSENEIREKIEREGGLEYNHKPEYPKAVWDIQRDMVKDEWKNAPDGSTVTMESGDVLKVNYNQDKDIMVIIDPSKGEEPIQTVIYDYTHKINENFGYVFEEMGNWPEYQQKEMESIDPAKERGDMEGKLYYEVFNEDRDMDDSISHRFESFHRKADEMGMLSLANEIDKGYPLEQKHVNLRPLEKDETLPEIILASDGDHTVTYSEDMDLYFVYRKVGKEDIVRDIEQNGVTADATKEVLDVARENELKNHPTGLKSYVESMRDETDVLSGDLKLLPKYGVAHRAFEDSLHLAGELDKVKSTPSEYDRLYKTTLQKDILRNSELLKNEIKKGVENYKKSLRPAHEDSNIETNVVADAKKIAATGIPMERAEKIAKERADGMAHEELHHEQDDQAVKEKKEEQDDQAVKEKKEEQEAREKEQKIQQEAKKETKPSMAVSHAAILLAALTKAEENKDGIWMNRGYRQNASFLYSKTPIQGYNNVMMNLHAEQQGYRSNVYTHFDNAKSNGTPVLAGQQSLPFSWTSWKYVNQSDENVVLSSRQYHALAKEDRMLYAPHAERGSQKIFNIDQTIMPASNYDAYIGLVKERGDSNEALKMDKGTNIFRQYSEMSKKHPDAVILMRDGDVYRAYKGSAKRINEAIGLPMGKAEYNGEQVNFVEFNHYNLDNILPKLIMTKNRVAICDQLQDPRLVKSTINPEKVLNEAYKTAQSFAKTEGMKYERVMVVQDAEYDVTSNTLKVSGMSTPGKMASVDSIGKANDIYRKLAEITGTEERLDRSGRNHLTPIDDMKYDKLVQEIAAGVLMARQGLPATISKENMDLIPYWKMEIRENPKMMGIIERDVNNSIEVIDKLSMGEKPDYRKMRGKMPEKTPMRKEDFTVVKELNKYPSMEAKEFVLVKDKLTNSAAVILPKGASLKVDNEVQGMRKDRIAVVLRKEGIEAVTFHNAGGSLGLKEPNAYFKDKEVSVVKLKQFEFVKRAPIDVKPIIKKSEEPRIQRFRMIRDEDGKYFFHIKPEGENGFCVAPEKKYVNSLFEAIKSHDQMEISKMTKALSGQFYKLATEHEDVRRDFITPRKVEGIDYGRIRGASIASSSSNKNEGVLSVYIDGVRQTSPISKPQFDKFFCADDKNAYKTGLAAVVFEQVLRRGNSQEQDLGLTVQEEPEVKQEKSQSSDEEKSNEKSESIKVEPSPERRSGMRMH